MEGGNKIRGMETGGSRDKGETCFQVSTDQYKYMDALVF